MTTGRTAEGEPGQASGAAPSRLAWMAATELSLSIGCVLSRAKLTAFYAPLCWIFAAWCLQGFAEDWLVSAQPDYRQRSPLCWYDTDWIRFGTNATATTTAPSPNQPHP